MCSVENEMYVYERNSRLFANVLEINSTIYLLLLDDSIIHRVINEKCFQNF